MNSNNKILTVSYGTFSCTLEGFDDSFGTMKAIAEYFRDLSADDRYFGAEPVQPDAEMLTRIAEREISRRVEARQHDGRIVLSASDAQIVPTNAAPDQTNGALTGAATAGTAAAVAGAAAVAAHAKAVDTANDSVVANDDAIAETASEDYDAAQLDNAEIHADEVADTATADVIEPDFSDATSTEATSDDEVEEEEDVDGTAEAFFADSPQTEEFDDALNEPLVVETDTDVDVTPAGEDIESDAETNNFAAAAAGDSIAAKLKRIRAVVSQGQNETDEDELFEDEHAEDLGATDDLSANEMVSDTTDSDQPTPADVMAEAARDIEDAARLDDEIASKDDGESDNSNDNIANVLSRLENREDAFTGDAEMGESSAEDSDMDASGIDSLATLMAEDDSSAASNNADDNLFDADSDLKATDEEDASETVEEESAPASPPRRLARIVKVKRKDINAALANGQIEEVTGDEDAAEAKKAEAEASLSDQDEAELMAELAEVETEIADVETELAEETADAADDQPVAAAKVTEDAEVNDDDVSRLMAEADNQMDEPEGHGRRNAFAHLKAAVMAKKADSALGNDSVKDEDAFRSDLASAVKPRRPAASDEPDKRPETPIAAPLKLVAEQRVDADSSSGPVHPRRIAAVDEPNATKNAAGSFAEYAADQGAIELPALLEAAASYLSFVEGRDQFSRPQLMNTVRQVEKDEFSREDGLRSFGQLLRAGKIEKTKGGRFAVTNDIGFRPDERAVG